MYTIWKKKNLWAGAECKGGWVTWNIVGDVNKDQLIQGIIKHALKAELCTLKIYLYVEGPSPNTLGYNCIWRKGL